MKFLKVLAYGALFLYLAHRVWMTDGPLTVARRVERVLLAWASLLALGAVFQ